MLQNLNDLCVALAEVSGDGPATLDLVGHSTRGHHYLRVGSDVLDMLDFRVVSVFEKLVDDRRLERAGITQIRLLGCETAVGVAATTTLARLARLTDCPVFGTTKPLLDVHYGPDGFRCEFEHLLARFPAS